MALLYDAAHNPLTTDESSGIFVDDGATPATVQSLSLARQRANTLTAMLANSPTIPVDGSGNLLFTLTDWQTLCAWAARPYDSFDSIDLGTVASTAMTDLSSTGTGSPVSQADILLDLIWVMRTKRRLLALPAPNPVLFPNDFTQSPPWTYGGFGSAVYASGDDPANQPSTTLSDITFVANSTVSQGVNVGQPRAGRSYTFQVWLRSVTGKATIVLAVDATNQVVNLAAAWGLATVTQTLTGTGGVAIILDNRVSSGGDGIAGHVQAWGATLTCNS